MVRLLKVAPCAKRLNPSQDDPALLSGRVTQWRIQDLSEGQAQSQDSGANMTSDVVAKRSHKGEALALLGGPGACSPGKF